MTADDDIKDLVIRFADSHPDTAVGELARKVVADHNQAEHAKRQAARPRRGPRRTHRRRKR